MNTKRFSMTVIAGALLALAIAPGIAGAEQSADGTAYYQMIKKELIVVADTDSVVDFKTMKFLEDNTLGYHDPLAGFLQLDTADAIRANGSPCQGEGLVADAEARLGVDGVVQTYCSGEPMADALGTRTGDVPALIPRHPDWPDGFDLYPDPAPRNSTQGTSSNNSGAGWPIGYFDH